MRDPPSKNKIGGTASAAHAQDHEWAAPHLWHMRKTIGGRYCICDTCARPAQHNLKPDSGAGLNSQLLEEEQSIILGEWPPVSQPHASGRPHTQQYMNNIN